MELLYEVEVETTEGVEEEELDFEGDENYVDRIHLKLGGGTLGKEQVFIPEKYSICKIFPKATKRPA